MSLTRETTPTRPTGDERNPAGKASSIITTLAVMMGFVADGLDEIAINPEAFEHLRAGLDRVAEIADAVDDAGRWLAAGRCQREGFVLANIRHGIVEQAAQLDRVRASAWALADRADAARPALTLVAGGAA